MKEKLKVLITNSASLSAEIVVQLIENYKERNIVIVNYSIELNEKIIKEHLVSSDFKSFEIFTIKTKNIDIVKDKVVNTKEDDLIFVIGLENLFIDTATNTYTLANKNKTLNYKSPKDIDIIEVMKFIDYLYESQRDLVFLLTTQDYDISEKTVKSLENYDIEIIHIKNSNQDNFSKIQNEILKAIESNDYEESIKTIEKYETNLESSTYRQAKTSIFIKHGFSQDAITLLSDNYDSLYNNEKVSLAELLYDREEYHQAFNIAMPLFQENPLIINLPFLLSKLTIELNCFEEWYKKIIEVNSQDIKVLDISANYFTRVKKYQEAIELREQLFEITKNPYHLLLIEILKVEENRPVNGHIVENNIKNLLEKYPDNEDLYVDASFKLGQIWFEVYNSPWKGYFHFKNNLKKCNSLYSVESAKYRMKLLSNQGFSDKIRKPSYQKKYPNILPEIRLNELLDSIIILTHDNNGYIVWESFIDKAQSMDVWEKYLAKKLIKTLKELDVKLITSYISKSSLYNEPKELEYAFLVRKYFDENLQEEGKLKDIADGILIHTKSIKEKIWTRYYLAINLILEGEMQYANNQAISLWHLANEIQHDEYLSKLARYLGTLSWGIIQVKNHKYIEGISCIIVTIKYLILDAKEVFPFMEDTLRVLNIWIQENQNLLSKEELELFHNLFNSLIPNQEKNEILQLVHKKDWYTIYNKLGYKIYNTQEYNAEWGLDFYYYTLASLNLDKFDLNLLLTNIDNFIEALSSRLDTREKLLYGMSDILYKYSLKNENIFKQGLKSSLKLLSIAIEDIERKKEQFSNSYERAFLSDEHRRTYKLYLMINLIFYKMKILFPTEQKLALNIINTFDSLSPRTIKEQKENLLNANLTDEIKEIAKEYKILYDEMSLFTLNATKEDFLTKEYDEKSSRYLKLREILEKEHPLYKKDINLESLPIQLIQISLKEDEIYYQYVDTDMFIASLVITKEFISFDLNKNTKLTKDIDILSTELQNFTKLSSYNINEVYNSYYQISQKYFGLLLEIYKKHKYKKIYINPDLSKPLLSSNLIRLENSWLIEEVDFIVNVTNKNYFVDREEKEKTNFKIATLGQDSDRQMKETKVWINKDNDRKGIFIDSLEEKINNITFTKEESLLIVSHGIQGNHQNNLTGSLSIDGAEKSYTISDLKFINDLDSIFFLTCSSGSVSIGEYETSSSILNNILSKNINSAILCKWDVFLDVSLEISDKLIKLSENQPIEYALNQALRETFKNSKWQHPVYWAGIEIWKN